MREYPVDPSVREIWKVYPVRIQSQSTSPCHDEPTLLVQSMKGGFVTRNCPSCGNSSPLPESTFLRDIDLWVACPQCQGRMARGLVVKNYAFICERCDIYFKLADLLPRWNDL